MVSKVSVLEEAQIAEKVECGVWFLFNKMNKEYPKVDRNKGGF